MPFPFEKLEVYKRSLSFAGKIERLCSSLKGKVSYSILDQLTRAVISVPLNLAEGNGRFFKKEKLQFLRIAKGSLFETVAIIQVLHSGHHLQEKQYLALYTEIEIQVKMVTKLSQFLENNN